MAFDGQANPTIADGSGPPTTGIEQAEGCRCPYCGRTIPGEELEAQGYCRTDADGNENASEPAGNEQAAGDQAGNRYIANDDDNDAGIVDRFNARRPGPLKADAGRAAGLLSAARRMVKNKDY